MQQENFQSGQKILKQDLSRAQSSKEQAIEDRATDNYVSGVTQDLLNGMAFVVGGPATSITIRTGVGYNSNGERVVIDNEAITYSSANVTNTTPDGIGGSTLTPQSTGSKDITLTTGVVNLLYIQYLQTTDPLVFSLHKITGQKLFTKIDDGYEIQVVNAGNVVPSTIDINASAPGTGGPWIFLGLVDFRVGVTVSSSMFDVSRRLLFQLDVTRVVGTTPKADFTDATPPGNYGASTQVNFDQHVKAIGSTVPTAKNPHGLTLGDIGFSGKTVGQHEQFLHTSGIASGDQTPNIGNSLNLKINPRCPDTDEVIIYGLTATQFLVVGDTTLASTDLGTTTFSFVSLTTNTYYFWANSTTRALEFGTTAPLISETNKFLLWTVDFNSTKGASNISSDHFLIPPSGPCVGTSNFTNLVDNRLFGNLGGDNLSRDGDTDTVTINHNVDLEKDLNVDGTTTTSGALVASSSVYVPLLGNGVKHGLEAVSTSVSAVSVTADTLSVQGVVLSGVNITANITLSGAGGLDTGIEAISTWYYIYVITNSLGSLVNGLFSVSSTPTLPSGYTQFRRVGWVRNNASGDFNQFIRVVNMVHYEDSTPHLYNNPGLAQSFTTDMPPTSKNMLAATLTEQNNGTNGGVFAKPTGSAITAYIINTSRSAGPGTQDAANVQTIRTSASQEVDFSAPAVTSFSITLLAYEDEV